MENHLVPLACVLNRGVSAIKGAGLEGFHCIYNQGVLTNPCIHVLSQYPFKAAEISLVA